MTRSLLIMSNFHLPKGGDLQKQTMNFLQKLSEDDSVPGLHVEPINNCRDPKVRTGRVSQQYRAVLFRIDTSNGRSYVFDGVWNHDEAIKRAQNSVCKINPINGVSEISYADPAPAGGTEPVTDAGAVGTAPADPDVPTLLGHTAAELHEELGLELELAQAAARVTTEDELLALAEKAVQWQGLALIELSSGLSLAEVKAKLGLDEAKRSDPAADEAQQLLDGFRHPAARLSYTYIEDDDELREIIEGGDLAAWRVFLHPEQRAYATRDYAGPFRLTGGAGTGKTVVLVHRAVRLAKAEPQARTLLTTFTTNLAGELKRAVGVLDPRLRVVESFDESGVRISGIDALASAVIKRAGSAIGKARAQLLGSEMGGVSKRLGDTTSAWRAAIDDAGSDLPAQLRSPAFLDAEYILVVLPQQIVDLDGYLKVRRPGRGVRLNRAERTAVWKVIESYRMSARAADQIDFREAAALAAVHLDLAAVAGERRPFDHVLVDEGQDLTPAHWQLVRASVTDGPNDLFIAEDAHQRIYGQKLTLAQFDIRIVGRARRLTLNYRTTAQNLRFGRAILEPGSYVDSADDAEESSGYRSARSGPDVQRAGHSSATTELDAAADTVGRWLGEEDVPPESIAILVRDKWERDRVVAGLAERSVTVRPVDKEAVPAGAPVVMTMHRAKGTEFYKVLLYGVSASAMPKGFADFDYSTGEKSDALLRERSLLYVAATRARDELVVSWNRERSPLLPVSDWQLMLNNGGTEFPDVARTAIPRSNDVS